MKKNYTTIKSHARVLRKMALSILMMGSATVFAQNAPVDFESGGQGASWTWTSFENDGNAPLKIIANPFKSGINTSNTVAKLTPLKTGQP
jgi:hypothetical protein